MKVLEEYFNEMEDVREKHKIKHLIGEILTIALCAVASGVETVYEIGEFAKIKESCLKNKEFIQYRVHTLLYLFFSLA